jgi:hypothetical protein
MKLTNYWKKLISALISAALVSGVTLIGVLYMLDVAIPLNAYVAMLMFTLIMILLFLIIALYKSH